MLDWEDADAVRSPELRATWCRFEAWVGDDCVTRVAEEATGASRRSIYVPLYPLAEWLAFNWWSICSDHRPGRLPLRERAFSQLVGNPNEQQSWLRAHNLRGTGEGFPWPDLTIVPEGSATRLSWVKSGPVDRGGIRYLSTGDALVDSESLRDTLVDFIESVLTRLDEAGVRVIEHQIDNNVRLRS